MMPQFVHRKWGWPPGQPPGAEEDREEPAVALRTVAPPDFDDPGPCADAAGGATTLSTYRKVPSMPCIPCTRPLFLSSFSERKMLTRSRSPRLSASSRCESARPSAERAAKTRCLTAVGRRPASSSSRAVGDASGISPYTTSRIKMQLNCKSPPPRPGGLGELVTDRLRGLRYLRFHTTERKDSHGNQRQPLPLSAKPPLSRGPSLSRRRTIAARLRSPRRGPAEVHELRTLYLRLRPRRTARLGGSGEGRL